MTLAVIIVNYNVKYFLEQCLESVFDSLPTPQTGWSTPQTDHTHLEIEVYVVDNASVDGSVEMVQNKFPQVHLIANNVNVGFAKANNQALAICLREATADYCLLLNPDTLVERDTLVKCVDFFISHPDCGGLGVKMINGEGKYLKESKRGFPSPAASFFKISGLIRLFPHHRHIAAYYMGHLPDDQVNPVDILPGAFLMTSREALEKVGFLDESYFMYGEDIDFSWRIRLAGYHNYYMPTARIIHYKGESTKHGSINYVYTFYNAMSIFVQHYFSGKNARLFNLLLHAAIWSRATLSFLQRLLSALALPVADFVAAFAGFLAIEQLWSAHQLNNFQFSILNPQFSYYPPEYTWLVIPLYIVLLMAISWLYGGYAKPLRPSRIVKGMAVGSTLLLLFYSLLDESMRYSRALLLLGCAWTMVSTIGVRLLLCPSAFRKRTRQCLIVGSPEECTRIKTMYSQIEKNKISTLDIHPNTTSAQLADAIHFHKADEVIFCGKDIPVQRIIDLMTSLVHTPAGLRQVEFKIAPDASDFVIGSNRIHSAEDLYTEELNTLASPLNRRNKRMLDIGTATLLLLLSPILAWCQKKPSHYLNHTLQVLHGRKTWVGVGEQAIFPPEQALARHHSTITEEARQRIRIRYYRNYRIATDIQILLHNFTRI